VNPTSRFTFDFPFPMFTPATLRHLLGVIASILTLSASAQIVELRATINAAQEVPPTTSRATGNGVMFYNLATNTYDLIVRIDNFSNPVTDTHIQEGPVGGTGPAIVHAGSETVYTRTNSSTLNVSFLNRLYPGDQQKLLHNGAYLNFHSLQFPNGEIRGQLLVRPQRLYANFTVAQEQAAFPGTTINSNAYGAAVMTYDYAANTMSLRLSLFNFGNTLTNSHYHEGAPGVSGPVVVGLGAGTVAGYTNHGNGYWTGSFDLPYTGGDPIKLLAGGAYLNFHSNVYPNGETRGQVLASEETASTRVSNGSARGLVGGGQFLISGISINGPEPIRVMITAKGPSLTALGVTGALADPLLSLYDGTGRLIAVNDNIGTVAAGSELASIPGLPRNAAESALVVVLPPGNYTAVVSGVGNATGVALLETIDLRTLGALVTN
jgi:hypothetical protein